MAFSCFRVFVWNIQFRRWMNDNIATSMFFNIFLHWVIIYPQRLILAPSHCKPSMTPLSQNSHVPRKSLCNKHNTTIVIWQWLKAAEIPPCHLTKKQKTIHIMPDIIWYLSLRSVGNSGEGKENWSLEPDYKSNTPLGIETPSNLKSLPVKKKFNQFKIEFFPFLWSFIFLMAFMSFMESSSWP